MVAEDESAIICDFLEYYHISDYKSLPLQTAATAACGLPAESRTVKRISGRQYTSSELLQIMLIDEIRTLQYIFVKAHSGKKRVTPPSSLMDKLLKRETPSEVEAFDTPEAFKAAWNKTVSR